MEIVRAEIIDAKKLLEVQKESYKVYADKYGSFEGNPYYMELSRIEFNIKYRFGKYYKVLIDKEIVGGIFGFELDDNTIMQIDQVYIIPRFQCLGYGTKVLEYFFKCNPDVKTWYLDTIDDENNTTNFYKRLGFEIIDTDYLEEESNSGPKFNIMKKTNRK